jgi:hypothetical protein
MEMGMQMGRSGLSLNDRSITGDEQSHHTRLSLHVYNYTYTRCCECALVSRADSIWRMRRDV